MASLAQKPIKLTVTALGTDTATHRVWYKVHRGCVEKLALGQIFQTIPEDFSQFFRLPD